MSMRVGSVRAVTNATGGLVRRHDYFPFGEENEVPGSDSRRFAGKERDGETALDYFSARYYAARTGRFTTVDPGHVGGNTFDPQSWNAYAYARNNPLRFVDPTGTEYLICGYGGGCSNVSDQYFRQLERNPGAGIYLSNGYVYAVGSNQAQGFYRQTSVDPTFNSIFRTAGDRAAPGVNAAVGLLTVWASFAAPVPMAVAGCVASGTECSAGTAMAVVPGGRFWKMLRPFRGKTRTNGLSGKDRRFYEWDRTHGDVEVFDARGRHLGSANPDTGMITKPPMPGRRLF